MKKSVLVPLATNKKEDRKIHKGVLYFSVNFHFKQLVISEWFSTKHDTIVKFLSWVVPLSRFIIVAERNKCSCSSMTPS